MDPGRCVPCTSYMGNTLARCHTCQAIKGYLNRPSDRICLDGGPVKPSFKPVDPGRNTTPASYREGQRLISTKSCGTVKFGKDRLSLLEELVAAGR